MVQPGGEPDLPEEALGAEHLGEALLQHLERDHPVVPAVAREVDHGHSAVTDLALDRIAAGKGVLQSVEQVKHRVIREVGHVTISSDPGDGQSAGRLTAQARIAAAKTGGTLAQLERSSSAVIRDISRWALRWLSA